MAGLIYTAAVTLATLMYCHGICSQPDFQVYPSDDAFSVSMNGVEILSHSVERPVVFIGKGESSFPNYRGNYLFVDYVQERVALPYFQIREEDGDSVINFSLDKKQFEVRIGPIQGHQLALTFGQLPEGYDRVWFRLTATENEKVYGGGEQFSSFNLRGKKYPIWTGEQGVGRDKRYPLTLMADVMEGGAGGDYYSTYFPQPTFLSSRRYYCHVAGTTFINLDFSHENFHEIFILGQPVAFYFGFRESFVDLLGQLNGYLGRQPQIPEWVNDGVILGMQGGTDRMLELLEKSESNGVKVSALWIQDWSGKLITSFGKRVYWDWRWDPKQYPDLPAHAAQLMERGIRILVYINPHLIDEGSLFAEADSNGFLMKNRQGETYRQDFGEYLCGSVDFTNPEAFKWYKGMLKRNLLDLGIRGWMADFSEYIPDDAVFFNGETGRSMHNRYPVLWAQANHEVIEEAGMLGEVMYFMRAGGSGTSGHSTLMWAGDQNVDWSMTDGLASTVPAALSLAVSGVGLTHYDIGGYTTVVREQSLPVMTVSVNMVRSEELFFRGAQAAVFTAAMRTHEGNIPPANYQVYNKDEDLQRFSVLVNMFRALKPYTQHFISVYYSKGIALQRPLFLQYENDQETFEIEYQYLFGDDLLVTPVTSPGRDKMRAYVPRGDWVSLYDSNEEYTGPDYFNLPAPPDRTPVLYRKHSQWTDLFIKVGQIATAGEDVCAGVAQPGFCHGDSCSGQSP